MTVAEAVVAALLLIIGALAVMAVIGAGTRNTFRAEQSQVVVNRLQEELEMIKQLPFDEIAMPAVPQDSADPDDPNSRVSGTQYDIDPDGGNLAAVAYNGSTLVSGGTVSGGQVTAGPVEFESGDVTGDLYRYVVWLDDPSCSEAECPGAQDLKRVIVAIALDATASGGARAYQELHTDIADPEAQPEVNPGSGGGGDGEDDDGDGDPDDDDEPQPFPWNFWLTDTTCNNSDPPADHRQPQHPQHARHLLRRLQTGSTSGAPDLMFPEAPPLDEDLPPDEQPLYDYATDVEPSSGGTLDKGVQLRRPGVLTGTGCVVSDLLGSQQPAAAAREHPRAEDPQVAHTAGPERHQRPDPDRRRDPAPLDADAQRGEPRRARSASTSSGASSTARRVRRHPARQPDPAAARAHPLRVLAGPVAAK